MNRTLCALTVGALLAVMTACTADAPTGVTLDPLTVSSSSEPESSAAVTTASVNGSSAAPTTAQATPEAPTSEAPVEVTVPPEASALPLPTEQVNLPADNPQEEADRAAIEAVWRQAWDLYVRIDSIPDTERSSAVDSLVVGTLRDELINVGRESNRNGVTSYGAPVLHPYWYRPVENADLAVIGDCRDTSNFGDQKVGSGERTTVGVLGSNTVGQFVRIDGHWKLWGVDYINSVPCKAS